MNNIWKEMFSSQNNKKAQEQGGLFDSSIPQGVGSRKDAQVRLQGPDGKHGKNPCFFAKYQRPA